MELKETIIKRRSIRRLKKSNDVNREVIEEILKTAMYVPSAFNMQSYRIVVLDGSNHDDLWDIVEEMLIEKMGKEKYIERGTDNKIRGFRGGNGTLLVFEDEKVLEEKREKFKSYREQVPSWSYQGSGIIQYAIWLQLVEVGLSASLQHYNPMIDERVKERFKIDDRWSLISQIPYGLSDEELEPREFVPFEQIVRFEE
jgi:predicted oxidoreductase (fatty acid repression mutant protein)